MQWLEKQTPDDERLTLRTPGSIGRIWSVAMKSVNHKSKSTDSLAGALIETPSADAATTLRYLGRAGPS
jgi:hypothetical protein